LEPCSSGACRGVDANFELFFYDQNGADLGCSDAAADVEVIKSVGDYQGTIRAVEIDLVS
jgi:hypothetical protein